MTGSPDSNALHRTPLPAGPVTASDTTVDVIMITVNKATEPER
jgi:hypothetical protein